MEALLGRKLLKGEVVHHKDGDKANNDPKNLEVKSASQHTSDHWKSGELKITEGCKRKLSVLNTGTKNPRAKLSEYQVVNIRLQLVEGRSLLSLSQEYGVSKRLISMIRDRKRWSHL